MLQDTENNFQHRKIFKQFRIKALKLTPEPNVGIVALDGEVCLFEPSYYQLADAY